MAFARLVELAFIGCAALGVYGFVTAAKEGETRRSCTSPGSVWVGHGRKKG
jgi:hypothetical protein